MSDRKILGSNLSYEERIQLAQLTTQPGWSILVKLMAEACRNATEEVIRLDPKTERFHEVVGSLQMTARAINKFTAEVVDSVKVHLGVALKEAKAKEPSSQAEETTADIRFKGFKMPLQQSPEGEK